MTDYAREDSTVDAEPTPDRREPVGAPVVRGDPEISGDRADAATRFDPDDPESLAEAATVVKDFSTRTSGDALTVLGGAAACAALVRGEGSYKAAAARVDVPVTFLRKWSRVHDLPIAIRRHIALGDIAPTAAQHIARVTGRARFILAWSVLDNDLTVDDIREIASEVTAGEDIESILRKHGVVPGRIDVTLPVAQYIELRRRASLSTHSP
ncbi:MAG: hypothetical protein R3324_01425, partial [Halobacteriales archaeon]|nr:hypothetical protein [Halobacteriales archaeon]